MPDRNRISRRGYFRLTGAAATVTSTFGLAGCTRLEAADEDAGYGLVPYGDADYGDVNSP